MGSGLTSDFSCADASGTTASTQSSCKRVNDHDQSASSRDSTDFSKYTSDTSVCSSARASDRGCQHRSSDLRTEMHLLGEKMAGNLTPRGLRGRPELCAVDCGSHQLTTNEGLPHVLPVPTSRGEPSIDDESCSNLVQQDPCSLLWSAFLTARFEQDMITKTLRDIQPKQQIDL